MIKIIYRRPFIMAKIEKKFLILLFKLKNIDKRGLHSVEYKQSTRCRITEVHYERLSDGSH